MSSHKLQKYDNDLRAEALRLLNIHRNSLTRCQNKYDQASEFLFSSEEIIITSFMKSGTTLTQQIIYQLMVATGRVPSDPNGDDYDDISKVIPFIEARSASGYYESIHAYEPKVWKTHSLASQFEGFDSSKGKFLCCVRDGLRIPGSLLDFSLDWVNTDLVKGDALREEFFQQYCMVYYLGLKANNDGSYERHGKDLGMWFQHVKGWMEAKKENILFLIYEDMVKDVAKAIRMIAKFLCIDVTDEQVEKVRSKCDKEVMAKDHRFEDKLISMLCGWESKLSNRVKSDNRKGFKKVEIRKDAVEMYWEMFKDAFGVDSYEQLTDILRRRNSKYALL